MNRQSTKINVICAIAVMVIGLVLCRFLLFNLHGMLELPQNLFLLGLFVIGVAAIFAAKRVILCTPVGYICGFTLGMFLDVDGVDPGGGVTNNGWIIWTAFYLAAILVGLIWEICNRRGKQ